MNQTRVISTAALLVLLAMAIPAFAQKGQEEKGGGGGKAQQAQHQVQSQHGQQAKPQAQHQQQSQRTQQPQRAQRQQQSQRTQQAQSRRAQPAQRQQQAQRTQQVQRSGRRQGQSVAYNGGNRGNGNNGFHGNGNNGNHYGRIPDDRYRAHFGRDHRFRMMRPRMIDGYNRFQYGGYWFGFNEGWPVGWDYNDDVYVEYIGGAYYMYDLRHPGIHITLNLF
jgi:hypothetical protein